MKKSVLYYNEKKLKFKIFKVSFNVIFLMQPQCYNVPNNTPQTQFDVFDIELINASDDAKTISQNLFKKYKNSFNTMKVCTVNHMDNLEKAMNTAPKKRFQNFALEIAKIRSIDSFMQENKFCFETRQRLKKQKRDIEWQEMRSNPDEFDAETIRILNIQMECDRDRMLNLRVKYNLIKFIKIHIKKQLFLEKLINFTTNHIKNQQIVEKMKREKMKEKLDKQWKKMRKNSKKFDEETIRILNIQTECDRDRMLNLRVKAKLIKFIKHHLDYVQVQQEHHYQMTVDDHNWKIICQLAKTDSYTEQNEIDYLNGQILSF